jgi:hypothetical protein
VVHEDREARLREISRQWYGCPNDPLKLKIRDLEDLFGCDPTQFTVEELKQFAVYHPEIQMLTRITLVDEPLPPQKNTPATVTKFLTRSRYYRMMFPMIDRLSKKDGFPAKDSPKLKFDIGLDLAGCFLVGAGTVTSSTVPEAAIRVDSTTGDDVFFIQKDFGEEILVSAISATSQDGLGCCSNPMLVSWLETQALKGTLIVAKLTIEDLPYVRVPFKIVNKPRPHNIEVIVTFNIPGVDLMGEKELLESIVEANMWRNAQCAKGEVSEERTLDQALFDESLLFDERDFSGYGARETLPFQSKNRRKHRFQMQDQGFDKQKCKSLAEGGYFIMTDSVNMFTVQKLSQLKTLDQRLDFLSLYFSEEEAASLLTIMKFTESGSIELLKDGRTWKLGGEMRF